MADDEDPTSSDWKQVRSNKRNLESPTKNNDKLKQKTLPCYWLGDKNQNSPNRFASLDPDEDDSPNATEKSPKPPPIFVDHVSNIQPLIAMLNSKVSNDYQLKVVKHNQVKIQPMTPEAYSVIVKELELKNTELFTYKPKNERSFRTILKNMHPSVDVEDLKSELQGLGHKVTNMYNMRHRETKLPLPMLC